MKVTKEFNFCCSHMLSDYDGKCSNLHGHNYKMEVTLEGELLKEGNERSMVMDFGTLKSMVNDMIEPWDHALIIDTTDPKQNKLSKFMKDEKLTERIYYIGFRSTAENMVNIFLQCLKTDIQDRSIKNIKSITIKLWETPTSFAENTITF